MSREAHVRFYEGLGVKFLRPTHYELHWVLDVAFREDDCRVRAGYAAENFAVVRHIAFNLLKKAKAKVGIKNRRLRAALDRQFMLQLICG